MYAQKMSVMSDQQDQTVVKLQKDFLRDMVHLAKEMIGELCSSVLSANAELKSGWDEMIDQVLAQSQKEQTHMVQPMAQQQ